MNLTSTLPIETEQENSCGTQFITDRLGLCNLTGNRQLHCPEPWAERLLSPAVSQGYGITVDRSTSGRIGQSLVSRRGGMPRSKRRAPSSTNYHNQGGDMPPAVPEDNAPRHSSKRLRHTSSSNRRHQKSEDVSHASAFSQKRCIAWFREYTSPDEPDTLGPEGMEKFCEDIGVEPENVVMLVLAYTMNAKQMGFFTQQEWLKGLTELQCDTIGKLQLRLEYLRNLLNEPLTFKGIYRYAYDFARDKDQRSMDMGTAREMLQLLLGRHWPLYSQFSQFLEQSKYKVINKDQWCNILEFSRTISHDLSNYDLDGAWPVMLDEFVEWLKVQRGEGSTSGDAHGS